MSLKELVAERGLTAALIVDDGYDIVPRADDLVSDGEAWSTFFDDVGSDHAIIIEAFPKFDDVDASELMRSDVFVAALWDLRDKLRTELWEGLFERYQRDHDFDTGYLSNLETALRDLGIEPIRAGRTIPENGRTAPIIFADLFLGSRQNEDSIKESIARLRALLAGREAEPPLVVLMSRSTRLQDKKESFRDEAGLLGAMFRVLSKQDLLDRSVLDRTIERLARHREDALRLASFLHSWDLGLDAAKRRFLTIIRRLDLADYGQIRELLLDLEGQPLGSYLLDVFDRVLQHEIEADGDTITAAERLNEIDTGCYPPPYIAGSADLQELVYRSIYEHPERLRVTAMACVTPVSFGDILVSRSALDESTARAESEKHDVLVVMTPACDLARAGAKRVLLVAGSLKKLTPAEWSYKQTPLRTPIIKLPYGRRGWIRWDLKDIQTLAPAELQALLGNDGEYTLSCRLREGQALELQQKLLADLGRVGQVAQMPATFPMAVQAYFMGADALLQRMSVAALERDGGVCFVGRDGKGELVSRLVLSETACDELRSAVSKLEPKDVDPAAHATLARLQASTAFPLMLERGIPMPRLEAEKFISISTKSLNADGKEISEIVGLIGRNRSLADGTIEPLVNSALVLSVRDISLESAEAVTATVTAEVLPEKNNDRREAQKNL